jgi:hypothetical protein
VTVDEFKCEVQQTVLRPCPKMTFAILCFGSRNGARVLNGEPMRRRGGVYQCAFDLAVSARKFHLVKSELHVFTHKTRQIN